MKNILSIAMLIVALIAITHAQIGPPRNSNPMFPGHGPFNPRQNPWKPGHRVPPFSHRFRRSPDDKKNRITIEAQKQKGAGSSYNVDYGRKIYDSKHGSVFLGGGMNKEPHGRPQKHIGIQGQWRF